MTSNHKIIEEACNAIDNGNLTNAKKVIENKYPFVHLSNTGRQYSDYQKTKIFLRDGLIDRYSGEKMMFPPVLRLLSYLMPEEFPFHKNWKMSECHIAYWQLLPTVDHIIPVSRGGADEESRQLKLYIKDLIPLDQIIPIFQQFITTGKLPFSQ